MSHASQTLRAQARMLASMALLSLLSACGGSGADAPPANVANKGTLQPMGSDDALVAQVKAMLASGAQRVVSVNAETLAAGTNPTAATIGGTTSAAAPAFSTTTRQEAAVDEDDFVKTDGRSIYTFKRRALESSVAGPAPASPANDVQVHRRASDGSVALVQTAALTKADDHEALQGMHLAPDAKRWVALRRGNSFSASPCPPNAACLAVAVSGPATTTMDLLSVSDDGSLGAAASSRVQAQWQGDLVASRLIGNTLYVVSTHRPLLAAYFLGTPSERDAAIQAVTAAQVLPLLRVVQGSAVGTPLRSMSAAPLVTSADCFASPGQGATDVAVTTITAVDLSKPGFAATSRCFLGGSEAIYMAAANVYLATAQWIQPTQDAQGRWVFPADALTTDIHQFGLSGSTITYKASGSVVGHLGWDRDRTSYRLSEHQGDLRVLSFTGSSGWFNASDAASARTASPATLTVLRAAPGSNVLQRLATLPNPQRPAPIGLPNEQVYAVRFMGDQAYVVTFRRIDPLYVLDLRNPADPQQVGELKVTGFTNDLFPLFNGTQPTGLLLGVGREANEQGVVQGVKVSLFDVSTPSAPRLADSLTFNNSVPYTALDFSPRGISLFTQGAITRVGLPSIQIGGPAGTASVTTVLQRLAVDTQNKTVRLLPAGGASASIDGYMDLTRHRSVHIGEHVYWATDTELLGFAW
jgi:Beta propeller domain